MPRAEREAKANIASPAPPRAEFEKVGRAYGVRLYVWGSGGPDAGTH